MASRTFDLNRALQDWRQQMEVATSCRVEDLDELESHLRDGVAGWEARGLTTAEAFGVAAGRLGFPRELAPEWAKVHPGDLFRSRAIWMLAGALVLVLLGDLSRISSGLGVLIGRQLGADAFTMGWMGLIGSLATMGGAVALFFAFATGRLGAGARGGTGQWFGRAWFLVTALVAILLIARSAAFAEGIAMARFLGPEALGGVYQIRAWGQAVGGVLFVVGAVFLLGRLVARGRKVSRLATILVACGIGFLTVAAPPRAEAGSRPIGSVMRIAAEKSVGFDDALRSWREGRKDEALQQFLAVDFSKRPLFPKGSVLGYSEKEFMSLPRAVNEKMHPQILEDVRPMKGLAVYVKEAAAAADARGEKSKSASYLGQLRKCGDALQHPDSLALLQAVGKAFTKIAVQAESGVPPSKPK